VCVCVCVCVCVWVWVWVWVCPVLRAGDLVCPVSRVLVTGASGFIGLPLAQLLIANGEEVHALSTRTPGELGVSAVRWHHCDMLEPDSLERALEEVQPDRLVHLAWNVSHGRFWSAPENLEWLQASLRLLRAFVNVGGRRALLVGSCAEYAWGGERDLEEHRSALEPQGLYGVCKDSLRRVAAAYAQETGLELAWARLFFLYGPREQPERLVPAVIRSLLTGQRVATSAGTQVRDFMHVGDAAAALLALLQSDVVGPVNIASGRAVSVAEVLDIIATITAGADLIDRGARASDTSEPPRIVGSVERLVQEVGFQPKLSLTDGLAATIDWWREHAQSTSR
jgi:nucleoside-diphosphate-sugar epimerase